MGSLIRRLIDLPRPLRIGLLVISLAVLSAVMVIVIDPWVGGIFLIGLCLLAMTLGVYKLLLVRSRKKRAAPFAKALAESAAEVPLSVSDVAVRARLEELRTSFDKGITTFKQHGRDLYSLPWYICIGESGSGKTEMIRHCGIGFPPGLQDELQGTGGTINMDWWFTDRAVILDTAGRLTFSEVDSTDSDEWREFLRLLKQHRKNYPINGLLVAIPVDSLIQDDADTIERKAAQLARQLDLIQRSLGVRFPVIITVTKADMLTGFREFFGDMRDPEAQAQMIGWSNPAPLDDPFDPSVLDNSICEIRRGLVRRRLAMLQSLPIGEEGADRRLNHVDELFAFPEAMQRLTSRLKRYLELVFVAGEWTNKPLFLRGIYFTSSMQHGDALDEELANALEVPIDTLDESSWSENHAYFLRDVFVEKLFEEKGLVTRAANTRMHRRRRRVALCGTGALAATLFCALTIWGGIDYHDEIAGRVGFWTKLADQDRNFRREGSNYWRIVEPGDEPGGSRYVGSIRELIPLDMSLAEFYWECREEADRSYSTPLAFRPVEWLVGENDFFKQQRVDACRVLFEIGVVRPLFEHATERMVTELERGTLTWTPEAVGTLAQLIDIELSRSDGPAPRPASIEGDTPRRSFDVEVMLHYILGTDYDRQEQGSPPISGQARILQYVGDWIYDVEEGGQSWPPPIEHDVAVTEAVKRFTAEVLVYKKAQSAALRVYHKREDALLRVLRKGGVMEGTVWRKRLAELTFAKEELSWMLTDHQEAMGGEFDDAVERAYDVLLAAARRESAGSIVVEAESRNDLEQLLRDGWQLFEAARSSSHDLARFAERYEIYAALNETLPFGETARRLTHLEEAATQIDDEELARRFADARQFAAMGVADAYLRRVGELGHSGINAAVLEQARASGEIRQRPEIPLVERGLDARYDHRVGLGVLKDWAKVTKSFGDRRAMSKAHTAVTGYAGEYLRYWSEGVVAETAIGAPNWALFLSKLGRFDARDFARSLSELASMSLQNLLALEATVGGLDERHRVVDATDLAQRLSEVQQATELDSDVRSTFDKLLANWRDMDSDVGRIRARLLLVSPEDFLAKYGETSVSTGPYIDRFWSRFSVGGLVLLVDSVVRDADRAWQGLQRLRRFPLGTLSEDESQLGVKEVSWARELAGRVAIFEELGLQRPTPGDARDVFFLLTTLRSPLPEADPFDRIKTMLDTLPAAGTKPVTATIFVDGTKKTSRRTESVAELWRYLQVVQGGEKNAIGWVGSSVSIARVRFPGPDIRIRFLESDRADGPAGPELRLVGPWAPLRLLAERASRDQDDPHVWNVEVWVNDDRGRTRSIWMRLVFSEEIPSMARWPVGAPVLVDAPQQ